METRHNVLDEHVKELAKKYTQNAFILSSCGHSVPNNNVHICPECNIKSEEIIPNYALRKIIEAIETQSTNYDLQESMICVVTQQIFLNPQLFIPCGHSVEEKALERQYHDDCPHCKTVFSGTIPNLALKEIITVVIEQHQEFESELFFDDEPLAALINKNKIIAATELCEANPRILNRPFINSPSVFHYLIKKKKFEAALAFANKFVDGSLIITDELAVMLTDLATSKSNDPDLFIKIFKYAPALINKPIFLKGRTILHQMIEEKKYVFVVTLIQNFELQIDLDLKIADKTSHYYEYSPLLLAATKAADYPLIMQYLLIHGADPSGSTSGGITPLLMLVNIATTHTIAHTTTHYEIVDHLLKYLSFDDVNQSVTAISASSPYETSLKIGDTALIIAARRQLDSLFKTMLTREDIQVNALNSKGESALSYVIANRLPKMKKNKKDEILDLFLPICFTDAWFSLIKGHLKEAVRVLSRFYEANHIQLILDFLQQAKNYAKDCYCLTGKTTNFSFKKLMASMLSLAIENKDGKFLYTLIKNFPSFINHYSKTRQESILTSAVRYCTAEEFSKLVKMKNVDVNAGDTYGIRPLHCAVLLKDPEKTETLLSHKDICFNAQWERKGEFYTVRMLAHKVGSPELGAYFDFYELFYYLVSNSSLIDFNLDQLQDINEVMLNEVAICLKRRGCDPLKIEWTRLFLLRLCPYSYYSRNAAHEYDLPETSEKQNTLDIVDRLFLIAHDQLSKYGKNKSHINWEKKIKALISQEFSEWHSFNQLTFLKTVKQTYFANHIHSFFRMGQTKFQNKLDKMIREEECYQDEPPRLGF
ncbi:MAG: hypothetical protein A3F12_03115 [Gammaproteobacteria bacterium RIFCSPHIGHO2_12_FULL_38_14]|nr:MAG: hypothetical protein A3F12_03115 [Gammaproteobacteria bacterium RIFCSPHIGHO2_12_FULL_38_14]